MILGLPEGIRGCLFDLDGVLTKTATVHDAAWKEMFDSYLRERARQTGQPFVPFDPVGDYGEYGCVFGHEFLQFRVDSIQPCGQMLAGAGDLHPDVGGSRLFAQAHLLRVVRGRWFRRRRG